MVAFRKWFLALAVIAVMAMPAFAQQTGTPLNCVANSGVPPLLRAEGFTELTGDILIECQGGNPNSPFLANFQLFLNTNITSRLLAGDLVEALLLVDEPGLPRLNAASTAGTPTPFCVSPGTASNSAGGPAGGTSPACNPASPGETYQQGTYTVYRAARPVGNPDNQVVWPGIPVVPPGSNRIRTFRITNVRANANQLGTSQTLIPTQVLAFISVFPQNTLPIDNPQQVVGYVQNGMLFDVRNCANSGGVSTSATSFLQCTSTSAQRDFFADPLRSGGLAADGALRFREGFQTAFKTQIITPGQLESVPGVVYNSESGFVRGPGSLGSELGTAGWADSGTRLAARFVNIPAGVRIFVSASEGAGSTAGSGAVLVTTDPSGATLGGSAIARPIPTAPTGQGTLNCANGNRTAIEVPIANGMGLAVWEVTAANPVVNEELAFLYAAAYRHNPSADLPGIGTANVIGNLAPFYDPAVTPAATRMSSILPIPRFATRTATNRIFSIAKCVTNLLFPYVTNWAGFDTGIAIANTSSDPFGSSSDQAARRQAGPCTLHYYGTLANGNPPTRLRETTNREVASGETITMVLSTGGGLGLQGNANFQGYIIAVCDFLYAHAFAFITDGPIGQARVAEGYLALVLDQGTVNRTGFTGEAQAH